jgi:hypothetical protein
MVWVLFGLMIITGRGGFHPGAFSKIEFERSRGPANATTLRQFYREMTALSADPSLNGNLMLVS